MTSVKLPARSISYAGQEPWYEVLDGDSCTATVWLPAECLEGQHFQGEPGSDSAAAKAAAARQVPSLTSVACLYPMQSLTCRSSPMHAVM